MFTFLTIGIVLLANVLEYYFVNHNTFEDFYKRLEIRAIVAARAQFEEHELSKSAYEEIRRLHLEKLPQEHERFIPVRVQGNDRSVDTVIFNERFLEDAIATGQSRYRDGDLFYLAQLYRDEADYGAEPYIVVLSARNEFIGEYLNNLRRTIFITIGLTILLSIILGLWFTKLILRPIRAITHGMKDITANKLHLRLEPKGTGNDELTELTNTFNNMLNRLEIAFETQKNFISNASHELNTPLTTIIGESEYTLIKERDTEAYQQSMRVILFQAERLRNITTSLLHIAQTGFDGKKQVFGELRLDEIVYTAKETVDKIIPNNKVYINLELMPDDNDQLLIHGNQQLLETALVNVIINGCKYSDNDRVQVTIYATNKNCVVTVEDQGIGIPEGEVSQVFEPFFRASNTGKFDGYGIGLPLSRNIVRLHDGDLIVSSQENKGTKIKIILPIAKYHK